MRHPTYRQRSGARGTDDLEAEKRGARRSFTHIIIVCVVVLGAYLLVTAIQGRRDKRRGRKEDRHGE